MKIKINIEKKHLYVFAIIAALLTINNFSVSDLLLVLLRSLSSFLTAIGIKKRIKHWGTAYDSVTKQPLDPAYVTLKNSEGFHDLVIDEFKVATPMLKTAGETAIIEFVVDKAGIFEYYCSVGTHRAMGMKGNLIVEE